MNALAIPAGAFTLFSLVVCYKNNKSILFPGVIFNFIWFFAILANQINLNGFYPIHEKTYLVILVGLIAFNIPFLTAKNTRKNIQPDIMEINHKRIKIILAVQFIMILMLVPLAIRAIPFYQIYGSTGFRTIYAKGVEFGYMSSIDRMLYIHYGVFPLCLVTNMAMIFLWTHGIVKFRALILGLIAEALVSFCSGGRGNILFLLLVVIQAVLLSSKMSGEIQYYLKKIKRQVKWIVIGLIIALIYMSIQRGNVGSGNFVLEFSKTLSTNFSGGIQLLDLALQDPAEWDLNNYYLGAATLNGFLQIFATMVRMFSLHRIVIEIPAVAQYASNFFPVSPTQKMNAYVTIFYTFIQDFGYLGIIIMPIIIGTLAVHMYRRLYKDTDMYSMLMLSFTNIIFLFSTIRWRLMLSDWAIMIIYIYIICRFLQGKNFKSRIIFRR